MAKENTPDNVETFLSSVAEAIPDTDVQSGVLKLVDDFIKNQTEGLKGKNLELINENKKLRSSIPDGLDAKSIKDMLNELKGKTLDDYGNSIRAESQDKLNSLTTQLTEAQTRAQTLDRQYQSTLINLELRAAAERARVRPEAIDDFVALHGKNFELVDGEALSDGLSTQEYVAGILEKQDYWYPPSYGAGARGSRAGGGGLNRNSDFALEAAAQAGDMTTYRKIREKQKQG